MSINFTYRKCFPLLCLLAINLIACDDESSSSDDSDPIVAMRAGTEAGTEAGTMTGGSSPSPATSASFLERITIDDMARGPAFSTLVDMNNDGKLIGDLRSACYSPHFKKVIGIAMIKEPFCKASKS